MTQPVTLAVTLAPAPPRLAPALRLAWRYGISTAGPVTVSGAHFLVSLVFLRTLPAAEFGIFSFVLVVSAFAMSVTGAGLVLPATRGLVKGETAITSACFKLSILVGGLFAGGLTLAVMASGAKFSHAAPLGLFGAVLSYRWFARSLAYIEGRIAPPLLSDLVYGAVVAAGLGFMVLSHTVSLRHGGLLLLLAATASMAPFGKTFFVPQWQAFTRGRLRDYLPAFRDVTGWSLLGVALTEATLNAHAYLVTFIAGPGAFALPALGMLLMRPASLVQSALPDLERPAMMRALAARDDARLTRTLHEFRGALLLVLLATVLLATAIFTFAPQWLLKKGYSLDDVLLVTAISAVIMAVRSLRAPPALLLQAAGEFKALARIGGISAVVSVAATLALLLAFGPIASLGGILLGDLVILGRVLSLSRAVRSAHV